MASGLGAEPHPLDFPPPPAPPPHRPPPSTCDLHPNEAVTGFCASCLRERLAGLEASANTANAPGRKSTSALRSIFLKVSGAGGGGPGAQPPSGSSSFRRMELRRCKSFSLARSDAFTGPRVSTSSVAAAFEPQRRSCDVRGRSTLWSLFHQDDQNRLRDPCVPSSSIAWGTAAGDRETDAEQRNLVFPGGATFALPVVEAYEDEETGDDIRPVDPVLVVGTSGEIKEEEERGRQTAVEKDLKAMKDHIDLDSQQQQAKKPDLKEIAGSFWLAASVFSKKLQKWGTKQKLKRQGSKAAAAAMPAQKPPKFSQKFRDTQSEMALDAFRRSCDTDPRFSLDAARMSFDDPRYSLDEPRASWDGYLIGGRSVFSRLPPMLSVVEDAPTTVVQRSDGLIPVEEDIFAPGGSLQTRDYYLDSSSHRRRSLDRSSSIREQPLEMNEPKSVFNTKVTPAGSTELFHFQNGNSLDRDLKDWSSNSLRDDYSGSFESVFRDPSKGVDMKKPKRWGRAWNIWGFIHRRHSSRGGANVAERSLSESWHELQNRTYSGKFVRSNSNASSRSSFSINGGYGSMRRTGFEMKGNGNKKGEFVLERKRSMRYSPNHVDNGMLRFYLTPMRKSRRKGSSINGRHISSQYFTRSMLGLY